MAIEKIFEVPKLYPTSVFMRRLAQVKDLDDLSILVDAVQGGLAPLSTANLRGSAHWFLEAMDEMRKDWNGRPRWGWLFESYSEFLAYLNVDDDLLDKLRRVVALEPEVPMQQARKRVQAAAVKTTGKVLPKGGDQKSEAKSTDNLSVDRQEHRAVTNGVGVVTQRKLDALARRAPELLAAVQRGEMSTHAAAKAAGIVKEKSTVEKLNALWAKATIEERRAFLASIQNANF